MMNDVALALLNGLWATMRQRAMWHRGEGTIVPGTETNWPGIVAYKRIERAILHCGLDPHRVDVYGMLICNPNVGHRAHIAGAFVGVLSEVQDALMHEFKGDN